MERLPIWIIFEISFMKMYFVETQPSEEEYFSDAFAEHDLHFVCDLGEVGGDAEVVCIYFRMQLDAEFLEAHPKLRMVATRSNGYDHIDVAECRRRGVTVSIVRGGDSNTVAEHAFALILALARRLDEVRQANKQPHFYYDRLRSFDLKDKTLGVIGTGRIGQRTMHIAQAFGMKVLAYDPHKAPAPEASPNVHYVEFDELLAASHVISLHAPLTEETHYLFNKETFAKCRRGVLIINTARGGLIDTKALIEAMDEGIVGGAGLDVLEDESVMRREGTKLIADQIIAKIQSTATPEEARMRTPGRIIELQSLTENARLISRLNVVFTPHVAFNSVEAVERINAMTVESIRAFVAGKPINQVPEVGGEA